MFFVEFIRKNKIVLLTTFLLFVIPFFWLHQGQLDLGGDSTRLYFYDPAAFFKGTGIFDIFPEGKGRIEPNYYYYPYVALLAFLKYFLSSTTLIDIFNGLKLAGGFLGIYLIVKELLKSSIKKADKGFTYYSSLIAGIFYTVSFGSYNLAIFWDRAIMSHNQIFLNPIFFYLLLLFFLRDNYKYLWLAVLLSFVFSPNFGLTSAPPFFAFYPLAILFLFIFVKMFGQKSLSWKKVVVALVFFLGAQAFQMLPQAASLFDKGSYSNSRVFSKEEIENGGVLYFSAVSPHGKAILNLLMPSENRFLQSLSIFTPLIIIIGFILNKGKNKAFLLVAIFFIITFFLTTANITNIGLEFYRRLFYIPGFAMFRNFYTQWLFIFIFFYSLLLGFAVYLILSKIKPRFTVKLFAFVFLVLLISGIPLFSGRLVNNNIIRGSNNIKSVFEMDPRFEATLSFMRSLPDDGKVLQLPLTDSFRQIVYGKDGGAYEGPAFISYLYQKYSFTGYQDFGYGQDNPAYAEDIMKYSREKDYNKLLSIFNLLNIRYIYYDSDPRIYEKNFGDQSSYRYVMTSLPKTQKGYRDFLSHFPLRLMYKNGPYCVYEINKFFSNPTIFIPDGVYKSNTLSFKSDKMHSVFINADIVNNGYTKADADIKFKMVNLNLYSVTITTHKPLHNLLLVMQNTFHTGWKLIKDDKIISENTHILANGYANAWLINGNDLPKNGSYTYFLKLDPHKYFWYGLIISVPFIMFSLCSLLYLFFKNAIFKK